MRIIFVRHGHPNYEKDCLTPLGRQHAAAAAERLKDEGICRICGLHSGTASTISPPTSTPVTSAPEPEQEDSSGESLPPNPIDPEPPQKESGFLMPFLAGVLCGGGLVGAILGIAFAMSRAPQENDEGD